MFIIIILSLFPLLLILFFIKKILLYTNYLFTVSVIFQNYFIYIHFVFPFYSLDKDQKIGRNVDVLSKENNLNRKGHPL